MILNMETLKFDLTANMAIIRKPDSNETYYTYNFPHKIMILGLLGSIIGLNGYNYNLFQKNLGRKVEGNPEFYEKLKDLKIAIVPNLGKENFSRKIQVFNNSVGYASNETGNNLIVKEQWLENPSWTIYILEDESEKYKKIKDYLINKKCEYIPYIGKNDHFADIKNVTVEKTEQLNEKTDKIDSLYDKKIANIKDNLFEEILGFEIVEDRKYFLYKEVLPTSLNEKIGYDEYKEFIYTNQELDIENISNIYKINNQNIYYF